MASAHGKEKSSGEQSVMSVSTEELETIMTGFKLVESNNDKAPEVVLQRMLSTKTAISTSSSHAERMRLAHEKTAHQNFTLIGAGACGQVFQQSGTIKIAKRARTDHYALQLWNDYSSHLKVQDAFRRRTNLAVDIRIPQVMYYVSQDDEQWWAEYGEKFPVDSSDAPKAVLVAERILPLHKDIRDSLIRKYCPDKMQEAAFENPANADCLVRVYLGSERPQGHPSLTFRLRNFFLYVDDLENLNLDVSMYATSMAETLAAMHWEVKCDARDVEFVLGSAPSTEDEVPQLTPADLDKLAPGTGTRQQRLNFKRRTVHLWMIDFNQVATISMDRSGVESAVKAYMENDPYFPKPLTKLWTEFKTAYLRTSERLRRFQAAEDKIVDWAGLPEEFIKQLVTAEQLRLEKKAASAQRVAGQAYYQ